MDKEIKKTLEPIVTAFNMYKDSIKDLKEYEPAEGERSLEESQRTFLLDEVQNKIVQLAQLKKLKYWEIFNFLKEAIDYVSKETGVEFSDNEKHVIYTIAFRQYIQTETEVSILLEEAKKGKEEIKKEMAIANEQRKKQLKSQLDKTNIIIKELTPPKEN